MSRTRIVKGSITKIIGGNYRMFAKEDIEFHSNQKVIHNAKEGTFYDNPSPAPKLPYDDEPDFDIELELIKDDFVPLGIPNYKGEPENDKIKFKLIIAGAGVNQWHLSIKSGDQLVYELFSGSGEIEGVVVKGKKKKDSQSPPKEIEDVKSSPIQRFWPKGEYIISWDGFDINNIYDSALMKSENGLIVSIIGQAEFKKKSFVIEKPIKFTYKEVDWVDVKIDGNNFKIETTLRVNLKDGGENGLQCRKRDIDPDPKIRVPIKECDWENVPKNEIVKWGENPLKSRTRTFDDLKRLTLQGLKKHWSRSLNSGLKEGKFLNISDNKYEMDLFPENTSKNALNNISLLYNTNNNWSRSGNPGFLAKLSYNVGYIEYSNGWGYQYESKEDIEFEETAAHEIGHPILVAYGSSQYSWEHKGSSYLLPQDAKPTPDNDKSKVFMEDLTHIQTMNTSGEYYPATGEIDLMKYYSSKDPNGKTVAYPDSRRTVIAEKDALGLIWLTKISIL